MNYYEKHIGDFIRDTVGLTMLEDGAYNRLLDQVFQTERPLPTDKKEVYRLARANSTAERKAVDYVLSKYFVLGEDGYMQKRAQEQIEAYWDREPAEQEKRENAKIRQQRSRERRRQLFDELRKYGVTPAFNASMKTLESELSRVTKQVSGGDCHEPVTRYATATQSPITSNQSTSDTSHQASSVAGAGSRDERDHPTEPLQLERPVQISMLLRAQGVNGVNALHPTVACTWAQNANVTDAILTDAVGKAKEALGKQGRADVSIGYLEPIVAQLLAAAPPSAAGGKFNVAGLDHSSTTAAMAKSMQQHGVTVPTNGEISFN